ncbi:MAG: hypothetical protein MJ176_10470 [Treponema sp.]|nr:hypothetical protein [Treponema sp.]
MTTAATKRSASVLVLERKEEETVSDRILELRQKIHDPHYINNSIQRIAFVISKKLVENPEELSVFTSDSDSYTM